MKKFQNATNVDAQPEVVTSETTTTVQNDFEITVDNIDVVVANAGLKTKREQDELKRALKEQLGVEVKKGRKPNMDSNRQQRLAELKAKREAGILKLGRPAYDENERKEAEAKKEAKLIEEKKRVAAFAAQMIAKKNGVATK